MITLILLLIFVIRMGFRLQIGFSVTKQSGVLTSLKRTLGSGIILTNPIKSCIALLILLERGITSIMKQKILIWVLICILCIPTIMAVLMIILFSDQLKNTTVTPFVRNTQLITYEMESGQKAEATLFTYQKELQENMYYFHVVFAAYENDGANQYDISQTDIQVQLDADVAVISSYYSTGGGVYEQLEEYYSTSPQKELRCSASSNYVELEWILQSETVLEPKISVQNSVQGKWQYWFNHFYDVGFEAAFQN